MKLTIFIFAVALCITMLPGHMMIPQCAHTLKGSKSKNKIHFYSQFHKKINFLFKRGGLFIWDWDKNILL